MRLKTMTLATLATLGVLITSFGVSSQEFPTHPITLIVPGSPGGPLDLTGRTMADAMSRTLGQPVVVENHSGANGVIGTQMVARAAPDGYTMLIATGSHTANEAVVKDLPYDVETDFTPLIQISRSYGSVMVTRPDFPPADIAAFVESAKGRDTPYTYSTSGYGNITHIGPALFAKLAGITMQDVQYKGTAASSMQDVMSGVVDMTFANPISAAPFLEAGTLKAYAITGSERSPSLPDVPTFQELGYDLDVSTHYGMHLPAGTPQPVVDKLYEAALQALDSEEVNRVVFGPAGMIKTALAPAEFAAFIKQDLVDQAAMMTEIGLEPQ